MRYRFELRSHQLLLTTQRQRPYIKHAGIQKTEHGYRCHLPKHFWGLGLGFGFKRRTSKLHFDCADLVNC